MKEYNAAFFGLYEAWFKQLKAEFGEEKTIALFRKVMEAGLMKAYGSDFKKGDPSSFVNLVSERDDSVGLTVSFPVVQENKIVYQFNTDPFPNLKSEVAHEKLDDTYIAFKVRYILGDDWEYKNNSHIWDGDDYTEFAIFKSGNPLVNQNKARFAN